MRRAADHAPWRLGAAFEGEAGVLQSILSLPARLLAACGVSVGMQQPGTRLQMIHLVCFKGHMDCLRLLLAQRGVEVNAAAGDHDTPLHKACFNGHVDVVRQLLSHGADPNATTPISMMMQQPTDPRTGLAGPAGPAQLVPNGGRTPMHYTVFNQDHHFPHPHAGCVQQLLDGRADPNRRDCFGLTALHYAAFNGFAPVARVLLACPAVQVNAQCGADGRGDTPLMKACFAGRAELVEALLQERPSSSIEELDLSGADPNIQNREGATALHYAADRPHEGVVAQLVRAGARIVADWQGVSPLDVASMRGHAAVAALLRTLAAPSAAPAAAAAAAAPPEPAPASPPRSPCRSADAGAEAAPAGDLAML